MATKKWVVYYTVGGGSRINRDYPEYPDHYALPDVNHAWTAAGTNAGRHFQDAEAHDVYTQLFAATGLVSRPGSDPDVQNFLFGRLRQLAQDRLNAQQAKQATLIQGSGSGYGGAKPGDIVRDQNGRSGRVPHVELEVFRHKPIDPEKAWKAVQDACKGTG